MKLNNVTINRVYNIFYRHISSFPIFGDFGSEPGYTWTLIQSHSLQNNDGFQDKPFYLHDMPINQDVPEWNNYRLLIMSRMKSIRDVPLTGVPLVTFWLMGSIFAITFALHSPTPIFWQSLMEIAAFCTSLSTSEKTYVKTAPSILLTVSSTTIISTAGGTLAVTLWRDQEDWRTKITSVNTAYVILHSGAAPQ